MKKKKDYISDLSGKLKSVRAGDIMTKDVITTDKGALLSDIAGIMIGKRISGLPVVDSSGKLAGVITANDLFMVMDMISSGYVPPGFGRNGKSGPVVEFAMSTNVHRIKKETSLEDIIVLMKYKNAHTLPVMRGNKIVGVVGRRDVFRNFYEIIKKPRSRTKNGR